MNNNVDVVYFSLSNHLKSLYKGKSIKGKIGAALPFVCQSFFESFHCRGVD